MFEFMFVGASVLPVLRADRAGAQVRPHLPAFVRAHATARIVFFFCADARAVLGKKQARKNTAKRNLSEPAGFVLFS